jgi:alpha-L-fucosidase
MRRQLLTVALLAVSGLWATAQTYQPTAENLASRAWFQQARFGMFIHWGVYSALADGEWVMNNRQIPIAAYEKLPAFFNPQAFDPKAWVQLAKDAGMKYITITAKHHDGFALWHSRASAYNVVQQTPYGRDIIKLLADECRAQGMKLFFYYSQLDWHHPDYYPRGSTGGSYTGRPEKGNWYGYLDYMDAQLTELLTGYGEVAGIWFDGMWDKKEADWRLGQTYGLIHRLQPAALVGSNHHLAPFDGEDFQMFEKDLPGHNTTGFAPEQTVSDLPRETCETINNSWGFNLKDNRHKTKKELIQYLVKAAGYDANLLLNVGPMPDGQIQPEHQALLREMGAWLKLHGETIYGTRGGPIPARDWGVTTQKGNTVYVHVLNWPDPTLTLPPLNRKVVQARLFANRLPVRYQQNELGLSLHLPAAGRDEIDTIVELTLK